MEMAPAVDVHDPSILSENNHNPIIKTRRNSGEVPLHDVQAATSEGAKTDSEKLTLPATSVWASTVLEKLPMDNVPVKTRREFEELQLNNDTAASSSRTRRNSEKLPLNTAPAATGGSTNLEKLPLDTDPAATSLRTGRNLEKLPFTSDPSATSVSTKRDSEKLLLDSVPAVRAKRISGKQQLDNHPAATCKRAKKGSVKLPMNIDTSLRTRSDLEKLPVKNGSAGTSAAIMRDSEKLTLDSAATNVKTRRDSEKLRFDGDSVKTRRDLEKLQLSNDSAAISWRTRKSLERLPFDNGPAATSVGIRRDSETLPVDSNPAATSVRTRRDSETLPVDDSIHDTHRSKKEASSAQKPDDIVLDTTPWMGVVGGDVGVGSGKHVRQTDGATGQEEDRTPASSPRSKETGQRSCGSKQAAASNQIIGDLQLPFNASTPLTSQQTFSLPPQAPIGPHRPPRPPPPTSSSTSLVQQQLTVCMQCPLPLPLWLVNAMSKVQSCGAHNPAPGSGLKNKKRGNRELWVCLSLISGPSSSVLALRKAVRVRVDSLGRRLLTFFVAVGKLLYAL